MAWFLPTGRRIHEGCVHSEVGRNGLILLFPLRKQRGKGLGLLPPVNLGL